MKAKLASKIFHLPGMLNYDRTKPDRCYRDGGSRRGRRPPPRQALTAHQRQVALLGPALQAVDRDRPSPSSGTMRPAQEPKHWSVRLAATPALQAAALVERPG